MTGSSSDIRDLLQILSRITTGAATKIAITAHVRPDGDAIGSAVGLYHLLSHAGYNAEIIGLASIPAHYAFLCQDVCMRNPETIQPDDYALLIVLDTGALDRAPPFVTQWHTSVATMNIDHHPTNTCFAERNVVIPEAAAVAEIIVQLALAADWKISREAATALWIGLITDTGRFAYSCTTPKTLVAASHLLQTGIDTPDIDHRIFQTASLGALRLQALAVQRMQLLLEQRVAIICLTQQDFHQCDASAEDSDDIINIPRRLESVEVALLLTEMKDSTPQQPRTKASFRTKPPYDAGAFCQQRGGGGHARAAGCELACSVAEASRIMAEQILHTWFQI